MNEILFILIVFICGIFLGIIFFGGLWLTIKKSVSSKMPGLLFMLSFFIRTGITLLGFYYLGVNNWKNMIACLVGFILARVIIKQYTKQEKYDVGKEISNEA
ncbi:MAG: ATP synthase subunit I [Bacteroidia bacterium]